MQMHIQYGAGRDPENARVRGAMRRGCGGKIGCNALRTVRKPDQHTRFISGFAIYLVWQNRENPLQAPANITGQANADQTHVRVDQLNFAAQNKHRQALLHQGAQIGGYHQLDCFSAFPDQKRGQQTSFRRAQPGAPHVRIVKMLNIVAQLIVQKTRCIRTITSMIEHVSRTVNAPLSAPVFRKSKLISQIAGLPRAFFREIATGASAKRHSITSIDRFSLKFCTAIEWPAESSTWPRCCSSAFIGTIKNPANMPTPSRNRFNINTDTGRCSGPSAMLHSDGNISRE